MREQILIVDDEKEIADLLEVYLKNDGYSVYKCYSGMEALHCMEEVELDLAILDVMLPDLDGFPRHLSCGKSCVLIRGQRAPL